MNIPKDLQTGLTVLMRTLDEYNIACEYSVSVDKVISGVLYTVNLTCFLKKSFVEVTIPYRESYKYSDLKFYLDRYLTDVLDRRKYEDSF